MKSARAGGSSWLVGGLVVAALSRAIGCSGDPGTDDVEEHIEAVLADFGPWVVEPALEDASLASAALATAVAAWGQALSGGGDGPAARVAAQAAWVEAMAAWQVAELLQIGPAASSLTAVGGEDRREAIYSWPEVDRCHVDQITVAGGWSAPGFFDTGDEEAYGLAALEVLLFSAAADNGCPLDVAPNADGAWAALDPGEVDAARAAYARVLADRVAADVDALRAEWDPAGGDFGGKLARAGSVDSPYESDVEGLNAILDALYYLEETTEERKLAQPLGLETCIGDDCLAGAESPLAGQSTRWVQINVDAFRAAYEGGAGAGIDDLLRALGHGDVADRMSASLDAAAAAASALHVPIEVAATDDPETALAVVEALEGVIEILEGDLATVLVLQVPDEASGDND